MAGFLNRKTSSQTPYLSPGQQDLLVAALNSQKTDSSNITHSETVGQVNAQSRGRTTSGDGTMNGLNGSDLFVSPPQTDHDGFSADFTPDIDYLDGDGFDFDDAGLQDDMIGALPDSTTDGHEKRKGSDDLDEGDTKRQETQEGERSAKKPGRKPLTNEPTTKRKAQNRAAQRAFRERKEKHLKDLETKVTELEKADEVNKLENGVLKAQVERLQVELRNYRKRLSLNNSTGRVSPPVASSSTRRSASGSSMSGANNFSFDFPKFGSLPGAQILGNGSLPSVAPAGQPSLSPSSSGSPLDTNNNNASNKTHSSGSPQRANSSSRSTPQSVANGDTPSNPIIQSPTQFASVDEPFAMYSNQNNMHGFASTLPQMKPEGADPFGDLFSPSILKTTNLASNPQYFDNGSSIPLHANLQNFHNSYGGDNSSGIGRVFQFNSGTSSGDSTSPSATSSNWNGNVNSSCETSPEPAHGSPATNDRKADSASAHTTKTDDANTNRSAAPPRNQYITSNLDTLSNFGNTLNSIGNASNNNSNSNHNVYGFSDYAVPTSDSFDPLLFGDYRESNEAIIGAGDFSGGFFDDALNNNGINNSSSNSSAFDMASPSNLFGILQSPGSLISPAPSVQHSTVAPTGSAGAGPTPSQNLMASLDKVCDGGDDDFNITPATKQPGQISQAQITTAPTVSRRSSDSKAENASGKMISCNNIWNQLQSNRDFQDGKFDLEGLCSELRTKARCSESGVQVDQGHVDAALRRLGDRDQDTGKFQGPGTNGKLLFEQASWDNVLRRMNGSGNGSGP